MTWGNMVNEGLSCALRLQIHQPQDDVALSPGLRRAVK